MTGPRRADARQNRDRILEVAREALLATGEQMPEDASSVSYPDLDPAWDFDFDDRAEMARRLPRLTALYEA